MTEIVKNDQVTYTKKFDGYNESHDFLANQELTVTVTLAEYRELVKENSTSHNDISELKTQKWNLQKQVTELEEKIETLKSMFVNNDDDDMGAI